MVLCTRQGSASEIARRIGVSRAVLYKWKDEIIGNSAYQTMRKHNAPSLEAERDALREEVARLNQEIRRRQMELDILKKAEEIIKKDPGISISHLNNREKTKIADALRQTYPLTELLHVLGLARSSYFYHRAALKASDKYATIRTMLTDIFNSNYQCYGYRRLHAMLRHEGDRLWALLRRQAELDGMPAINAKRVYRIMRQNALLLERKTAVPPSKRAHTGKVAVKESNQRWCSDGFEFRCDNGEKLRVTFALDCCDREALHWAVTTGGFDSETVQDVMLGAVERRFGNELPASPVEWLTDNGSCYRANETRQFARMLGLEPKNTAVRSPESNGIAESFVKTIKRDYISIMILPT